MKQSVLMVLAVALAACGGSANGPEPIHYDRDTCEQCRMIISDSRFAAEVRDADGVLHRFDDPGGAIVWMAAHHVDPAKAGVWVMNVRDGKTWLDAHKAYFAPMQTTPMDYGYGAIANPEAGALDFDAFRAKILAQKDRAMGGGAKP